MLMRVGVFWTAARALLVFAVVAVLAGCGASEKSGLSAPASADPPPARQRPVSNTCAETVMGALGSVVRRVYHEGVSSERTASALKLIHGSPALRTAVEREEPAAARAAAQALIATGHMTNLKVIRAGRVLADVGGNALSPLSGSIYGIKGTPIASFQASVWADNGFVDESNGVLEGLTSLRGPGGQSVGGSLALPAQGLAGHGRLTLRGVPYAYTSFPIAVYPSGSAQVYLLKALASIAPLCAPTQVGTVVNTIGRVAHLIYEGEAGRRALVEVHRVQSNQPLLQAVARRDPLATREAIDALLNQHIVRLRVSAGGQLLSDVGGPDVLAPVRAPLRLDGRQIGNFVLSIQDDLGYLLLAQRLAGLRVVMHRGPVLVMSSLRPVPAGIPASGPFAYGGHSYRVITLNAQAFPSGPLRISVLIPIPYT